MENPTKVEREGHLIREMGKDMKTEEIENGKNPETKTQMF